jgi:TP901 family phage tail tape measure protein
MADIGDLRVMITGDTAGIESAVKRALNVVTGGVEKMNDQEVDWTSIFSRSVSPAIISGIASLFAFAISQAVNFQAAMATTGTAAGQTSSQIGQMSQQALGLSTILPNSAQDLATTMTAVSGLFGTNTQATNDITQALAQLSDSGFGDLNDVTSTAISLFQQFGVTTEAGAIQVLTDLMHAAEGAKQTIPALGDAFNTFAQQLPGADKSVSDFNGLISTFGAEVQNLGLSGTTQIFSALAASANSAVGPMEILGQSFGAVQKSLLSDGGLSAIEKTSAALQAMGPGAALVATNFGLSAQQVDEFQTNAKKLGSVATDAKAISTNTQSIKDAYNQSDSALRQFDLDWNHFKADAINIGTLFEPMLLGFAKAINEMLTDADNFFTSVQGGVNTLVSDLSGKSLFGGIITGIQDVGTGISETFKEITAGTQSPLDQLLNQTSSQGSGAIFSSNQLSAIDSTANSSGLMQALVSALQGGLSKSSPYYTQLHNTFNLTVPSTGAASLTAQAIAKQLYNQFQGLQ